MGERVYFAINERMARAAHDMMSMTDYKAGSKTAAYKSYVDEAYDLAEQIEREKPKQAERAWKVAAAYAHRLADNMNAEIRIGTMCPSVLVTGAGNFPTKKKEKQVAAWDRNMQEFNKIQQYLDTLKRILHGREAIRSDDSDALILLEERLSELEAKQTMMKEVNAYYRKHKTLEGCPEIDGATAQKLEEYASRSDMGKMPFASFTITNNGANIRRIKKRIEDLQAEKSKETTEAVFEDLGLIVKEDTDIMRIQFFFDDIPAPKIRELLKRRAFKWSYKNKCWQRQLTNDARYATRQIIEQLKEVEENET